MTEENKLHAIDAQRFVLLIATDKDGKKVSGDFAKEAVDAGKAKWLTDPGELHNRDPGEFTDVKRNALRFQRWRKEGIETTACGIEYNPGSDGEADGKIIVHEGDERPRCAKCAGTAPSIGAPEAVDAALAETEHPQ
jgi:hypothetical protein